MRSIALAVLLPALGFSQDEIKIPNVWPIPFDAPSVGQMWTDFGFTWDPTGYIWESLSAVVTQDYWGNRYGFLAIRLTEGQGVQGFPRIFVADIDGSGPSFTNFGAGWSPDATTKSVIQVGDDYALTAGPPGAMNMAGNWVYRFHGTEGSPVGNLISMTDPIGRVYQFDWHLESGYVEVTDPTAAHPIRIHWSTLPSPYTDAILASGPFDDPTKNFGRIAATDPAASTAGADWGASVGEDEEALECSQTLSWIVGQTDATATLVDAWSQLVSNYVVNPQVPYVSDASQSLGSTAPVTIAYTYNDLPDPELLVDYGRSVGYPTHEFHYTHHPTSNTTELSATSLSGLKFQNAWTAPSVTTQLDSQGLPVSIQMSTEIDGNFGSIDSAIDRLSNGNVWRVTDFEGNPWLVGWDGFNKTSETWPNSFAENFGYGTDWYIGNGNYDPNTHNPTNALTQIWNPAQNKWHINYGANYEVAEIWEPRIDAPTKLSYYSSGPYQGWTSQITDASGRISKFLDYSAFGNVTSSRNYPLDDPSTPGVIEGGENGGVTTQFSYNVMGQPTQILYSDGNHFDLSYTSGKLVHGTDERGRIFNLAYNPAGSEDTGFPYQVSVPFWSNWQGQSYPARDLLTLDFNSYGQLSSAACGNGAKETYSYGALEEPDSQSFDSWDGSTVASRTVLFNYTTDGLIRQIVRPTGTVSYEYNKNRWLRKRIFGTTTHEYVYDPGGVVQSAKVTDSGVELRRTDFIYDPLTNWVSRMTQYPNGPGTGYVIDYLYTPDGSVSRETLKLGSTILQRLNYTYDAAGRVIEIDDDTTSPTEVTTFTYDGAGNLVLISMAGEKLETSLYWGDSAGHGHDFLERVEHRKVAFQMMLFGNPGAVLASYSYAPYPDNLPASSTEMVGLSTTNVAWAYDPYGQLRQETRAGTPTNFTYDLGGNLATLGTRTFTEYSAGTVHTNQLATDSGVASYLYDSNGARSQRTDAAGVTDTNFDSLDNLVEVRLSGSPINQASYDALDQRVKQTVGTTTSYYLYDQFGDLIAELNSAGNLVARYVWGPAGPVYQVAGAARKYYLGDGLGNSRLLVTNQGTITDKYTYDAWGNIVSQTGATSNPFRWNSADGYQYIPATKLYHIGAREYDPHVGRWLQRDPIGPFGNDPNVYSYCGNSPIVRSDPSGECWWLIMDGAFFLYDLGEGIGAELSGDSETARQKFMDAAIDVACAAVPFAAPPLVKGLIKGTQEAVEYFKVAKESHACFPAGTPVLTPTGYTAIDQLHSGDVVVARDASTGLNTTAKVLSLIELPGAERLRLTFASQGALEVTGEHPLYRVGSGWVPASRLKVGDWLVTHSDQVQITAIESLPAVPVYNLSVDSPHTYFVGSDQVLAHNKWLAGFWTGIKNKWASLGNWIRKLLGLGNCFPAGTLVWTEDGMRPIEQIRPGDKVFAVGGATVQRMGKIASPAPGTAELKVHLASVTRAFVRQVESLVVLGLSDGTILRLTEEHPVYVPDAGWVPAGLLQVGNCVQTRAGPLQIAVVSREVFPVKVYNLEVGEDHTYFVSPAGILVHNQCGQKHHVITRRTERALAKHQTLAGKVSREDANLMVRAKDAAAHDGYCSWHREFDPTVEDWLGTNRKATIEEFEGFLQDWYGRPDSQSKFPGYIPTLRGGIPRR